MMFNILVTGLLVILVTLTAIGVAFHQIAMREQNAPNDGGYE